MSKASSRKTSKKTAARKAVTRTREIPPLVAMVAAASTGQSGVPHDLRHIWAQMPAMMDTITNGEVGTLGFVDHQQLLQAILNSDIEWSRKSAAAREDRCALYKAWDVLDAADPDLPGSLRGHIGEVAYLIGFAYAAYVFGGGAR